MTVEIEMPIVPTGVGEPLFLKPLLPEADAAGKIAGFAEDGFLIVEGALAPAWTARLSKAAQAIFRGDYPTERFPDAIMGMEGNRVEDAMRIVTSAWKTHLDVARVILAAPFAEAACRIMGWSGARLMGDNIWQKPPGCGAGVYHIDESIVFKPREVITCWFALEAVDESVGTLEYAVGSHRWPPVRVRDKVTGQSPNLFHRHIEEMARRLGQEPRFHAITGPAGTVSFHHGLLRHASLKNVSPRVRTTMSMHFIREDAEFSGRDEFSLFTRYKMTGTNRLDDNFFPVLWPAERRSMFLGEFLASGKLG